MDNYLISVVIPVFNEENYICENLRTISDCLINNDIKHEFVLVDDGSEDNTWYRIKELSSEISSINAIRLSRNFGKEAALCAGLKVVKGDACIIMDSDLQHPPQLIPEMIRLWRDEEFEVIEGVKSSRGKESIFYKICAHMFYSILSKLSGFDLKQASDFKLLDKKAYSAWRQLNERNTFFRGMSVWVGFNRTSIPFVVPERSKGNSKWSMFRLFKLAVNAITSFSALPLQIVTFMGAAFLLGSIVLGLQTLYMKLKGIALSGFTTVILLLLIIGSTLMISIGIIGIYIAKIYDEVKYRPRYIVAEEIRSMKNDDVGLTADSK